MGKYTSTDTQYLLETNIRNFDTNVPICPTGVQIRDLVNSYPLGIAADIYIEYPNFISISAAHKIITNTRLNYMYLVFSCA